LGEDYFLVYHSHEIAWHTQQLLKNKKDTQVFYQTTGAFNATQLVIYTPDQPFLFARLTQTLENFALNIVDARLLTTRDGHSLNQFTILNQKDQKIIDTHLLDEVSQTIQTNIETKIQPVDTASMDVYNPNKRRMRSFDRAPEISSQTKWDSTATLVDIIATDRRGLLNAIAKTFEQLEIKILSAKINTIGERAEDRFEVTDLQDKPIESGQATDRMTALLSQKIEALKN
jgi:[protein-PII] uridylyltransferase